MGDAPQIQQHGIMNLPIYASCVLILLICGYVPKMGPGKRIERCLHPGLWVPEPASGPGNVKDMGHAQPCEGIGEVRRIATGSNPVRVALLLDGGGEAFNHLPLLTLPLARSSSNSTSLGGPSNLDD